MSVMQGAAPVPIGRIVREHRAALVPLAVVLVLNIIALVALVLPLSQRASSNEARAAAADRAQTAPPPDMASPEASREGTSRASTDLEPV